MNLLNDEKTDFSNEGLILFCEALVSVYKAQISMHRLNGALNRMHVDSWLKPKMTYINRAKILSAQLLATLNAGYDGIFEKIWNKKPGHEAERFNDLLWLANDHIQLDLIYLSRTDENNEKRSRMKKALLNFKPDDPELDLDGMLRFFDFKLEDL